LLKLQNSWARSEWFSQAAVSKIGTLQSALLLVSRPADFVRSGINVCRQMTVAFPLAK
jgi:hypothetical protein